MMAPILELSAISKDYHALRPLRIEKLVVAESEQVAIVGLDRSAGDVLVNVITGATLPERGEVRLFGRSTSAISEGAEWLSLVDRFGIVSERAVLLDQFSVIQNLAVPFTLEIEPPPGDVRDRAIALAREVGIAESSFDRPVAHLRPAGRARLRLGRALALDPAILILEHPTADMPRDDAAGFGGHASAVARRRGAAILALTADRQFADAVARRVLTHDAATGRLSEQRGWLSRRRGA